LSASRSGPVTIADRVAGRRRTPNRPSAIIAIPSEAQDHLPIVVKTRQMLVSKPNSTKIRRTRGLIQRKQTETVILLASGTPWKTLTKLKDKEG
jgi:hypothetical protein